MQANKFVKKFGWEKAKRELQYKNTMMAICSDDNWFDDLKRLVESWELIEFFGCLDDAIQIYEFSKGIQTISYGGRKIEVDQLKQAITDVEICQPDLPESVVQSLGEVS